MKTPQEAAREYMPNVLNDSDLSVNYEEDNYDAGVMHTLTEALEPAFLAGDAFGYSRGMEKAYRWISVDDELPDDDTLILTKDTDCHIDLIRGWQLKERIKPYAVQNFYTHWRHIERVKE